MPAASVRLPIACRLSQLCRPQSPNPTTTRWARHIKLPARRQKPDEHLTRLPTAQQPPKQDAPHTTAPPPKPTSSLRSLLRALRSHLHSLRSSPSGQILIASLRMLLLFGPPVTLFMLHLPYQLFWVQGASMSPYLNTHWSNDEPNTEDSVLVYRDRYDSLLPDLPSYFPRRRNSLGPTELQRGMIIVFYAPHNPDKVAVKRIIGLPGDRVTPLPEAPAYPSKSSESPNDSAVTIPWNHLWVEGDSSDPAQSIDSNWYGPITQSLVIGRVTHVLGPWFRPARVEWMHHAYPAEQQNRVQRDAVKQADPDAVSWKKTFITSGVGEQWLRRMKEDEEGTMRDLSSMAGQKQLVSLLNACVTEIRRDDPESRELAGKLFDEAERWRRKLVERAEQMRTEREERQANAAQETVAASASR